MASSTNGRPPNKAQNLVPHLLRRQSGDNVFGFRRQLFRERLSLATSLYKRDLVAHFGCVNAIEFSGDGELLVSGGDDRRVLLWHLKDVVSDKSLASPNAMAKQHQSNIFCLGINGNKSKIVSGGNDEMVLVHDVNTGEQVDTYPHQKPVYGLSLDATADHMFATAGEDGRVLVFDMRAGGTERVALAKHRAPFHAIQYHPLDGHFLITANGKDGAAFWDLRQTRAPTVRYGGEDASHSCMSVCFNSLGTQVLALRRRLPPILFNTCCAVPVGQFYHSDYYNSCTMKSCCFAGENDEYVLSGSDDFNLYVWRVTDADTNGCNQWIDRHQMVLNGHRSIVNQVRYNGPRCFIASSGVEKVIKLWSPFAAPTWTGDLFENSAINIENARDVFTHDEYMSIINSSGMNVTHDYSNQNTTEDPRMMAFFDSLVQREIEGWNSDDENFESDDKSSAHSSDGSSRPTSTEEDSSNDSDDDDDDDSVANYLASNVAPCRRARYAALKPRSIYANRIAYLIATKRNTLKRLALKGAAHTERRAAVRRASSSARNLSGLRVTRKGTAGKRTKNRTKTNKRTAVSHEDHEDNSDANAPKKFTKRRIQQHLNSFNYRLLRRKTKTVRSSKLIDSFDTSSEDDDDDDGFLRSNPSEYNSELPKNGPSTSSAPIASTSSSRGSHRIQLSNYTTSAKTSKYDHISFVRRNKPHLVRAAAILSKQTISSMTDDDDQDVVQTQQQQQHLPSFPTNADVPSTSTGITVPTGPIFRAQHQFYDSDEEEDDATISEQRTSSRAESTLNLVPVIPMPLNGTHNFDASCSSVEEDDGGFVRDLIETQRSNVSSPDNNQSDTRTSPAIIESVVEMASQGTLQVNRKRNARLLNNSCSNYSSHSNSRLSSSSTTDVDDIRQSSLNLSTSSIGHKRLRLRDTSAGNTNSNAQLASVSILSNTPINRFSITKQDFTPDSGFLTNITSSTSTSFQQHLTDSHSSSSGSGKGNGETSPSANYQPSTSTSASCDLAAASTSTAYTHRVYQKKLARVRRNYRKKICEDSDTD